MAALVALLGWLLVWGAGAAVVHALLRRRPDAAATPGNACWIAGTGFLVGAFAITLWMHALTWIHVPFSVLALVFPSIAVLAVAALAARRRGDGPAAARPIAGAWLHALSGRGLPRAARMAWLVLLVWLLARYALLWVDVVEQPLYPWDAWIQWATKARTWFELRRVVPFVDFAQWVADTTGTLYTDAAPGYPGTVPLWQVYSATLLGTWDDAVANIAWWFVAVALALAVFGDLRSRQFTPLAALAGATIVATLPLVNVHVALAGYADLPMAAYYSVAALAALRWTARRSWRDGCVAALLVMACPMIKTPGIVWALTLLVPLVALVPRYGKRLVALGFAAAALALLVLAQTSPRILNYSLHLDFAPPWNALFDSLFMLGSWNLLWYGVVAAGVLAWRQLLRRDLAPFSLLVAAGIAFLFIVFAFTNARAWVETQTTINRAVLHLAPLFAVWMMVVLHARFALAVADATAATAATALPLAPAPPVIAVVEPAMPADMAATDPSSAMPPAPEPPPATTTAPAPATALASFDALRVAARASQDETAWQALLVQLPNDPEAGFVLGNAATARGDAQAAVRHLESGLAGAPHHFGLLTNLGLAYERVQRFADAEHVFRQAQAQQPAALVANANLAQNLFQQKRLREALTYYDRIPAGAVTEPTYLSNLGVCLAQVHRFDEAEKVLVESLRLRPRPEVQRDLGMLYIRAHRWDDALRVLLPASARAPQELDLTALIELARAHTADWSGATARTQLIDAVLRDDPRARGVIDPFMVIAWTDDPAAQLAAARCWQALRLADAAVNQTIASARALGAPLRIGFVSSDFANHPVTRLLLGLAEQLDPARFALYAYATHTHPDTPLRQRLRARLVALREIANIDPLAQATQVRRDHIDMLVDLNGYTGTHATPLFVQRPAPLQVNFLGYTGTLGTPAYDLIVTDRYCIGAADTAFYDETPMYVEPCYLPSDPRREWGSDVTPPARSQYGLPDSAVVLAALSSTYKVNRPLFDVWMRVLERAPDSVLWLRGGDARTEANLRTEASRCGIDVTRLVFAPTEVLPRYFARWRLADLMLDTFPFGAHTTVNDALFAGVPVVAWRGRSFASRASASQLDALRMPDLVCDNAAAYEAAIVTLATDAQARAAMAARVRAQVAASPLFDMERYAQVFATALTEAWERRNPG